MFSNLVRLLKNAKLLSNNSQTLLVPIMNFFSDGYLCCIITKKDNYLQLQSSVGDDHKVSPVTSWFC